MNLKRAFQLLDLDAGASAEAFKKRYHDLAAVWHPDRHAQDDRSQALASERMKQINSAYEAICAFLNGRMTVTCAACGAENRKPADVNLDYTACSACGKQIRRPLCRKKRSPCGNPRCAGTIGTSGRCTYCGKTIAEGLAADISNVPSRERQQAARGVGARRAVVAAAAFCGVLVCLYAYRYELYHLNETIWASAGFRTAAADPPKPIVTPPLTEPASPIHRSGSLPIAKSDFYYTALFRERELLIVQ